MNRPITFAAIFIGSAATLSAATVDIPFSTTFESAGIGGSTVAISANDNTSVLFSETNSLSGGTTGSGALSNANGTSNSSFVDLGGGDIALRQSISSVTATSSASTAAAFSHLNSDFATAGGFLISTTFTVDSYLVGTGGVMNISLNAFSTMANLGDGYRLIYTLSGTAGTLTFQQTGAGLTSVSASPAAVSPTAPITLSLQGLYSGGTLNFIASVTRGGVTSTITGSDASGLSAGNIFGVRSALAMGGSGTSPAIDTNETVTFTDLSLSAIPEPGSLALAGFAITLFGFRRKRI